MQAQASHLSYETVVDNVMKMKRAKPDHMQLGNIYSAEDIEKVTRKGSDIMQEYSLTEENVKILKKKGKLFFSELGTNYSRWKNRGAAQEGIVEYFRDECYPDDKNQEITGRKRGSKKSVERIRGIVIRKVRR